MRARYRLTLEFGLAEQADLAEALRTARECLDAGATRAWAEGPRWRWRLEVADDGPVPGQETPPRVCGGEGVEVCSTAVPGG